MTIEQAVAAEREECAQLAEKSYVVSGSPGPLFDAGSRFTADLAAKSIRARGICVADIAGAVRGYFNALDAHHAKRCSYADVVKHEYNLRSLVGASEKEAYEAHPAPTSPGGVE